MPIFYRCIHWQLLYKYLPIIIFSTRPVVVLLPVSPNKPADIAAHTAFKRGNCTYNKTIWSVRDGKPCENNIGQTLLVVSLSKHSTTRKKKSLKSCEVRILPPRVGLSYLRSTLIASRQINNCDDTMCCFNMLMRHWPVADFSQESSHPNS